MKKMKTLLTIILVMFSTLLFSQNMPGDNLNLYAVLNLFQNSPTLDDFERDLNVENSRINNLDLNLDGMTDYIRVIDNVYGPAHAIVLQVSINQYETQDVAVIEVTKSNGQVYVQVVGDESLYGENYIVEPNATPNPGYESDLTYYTPATWLIVNWMYNPYYTVYRSPYYWGYYPNYWNPWRPYYYNTYYGYHSHYYNYYRRGNYYHAPNLHRYYEPRRTSSPIINKRYPNNQYKTHPTNNQYKQQPTRTQPTNQYKQQPTRTQPTNQYKPPVRTQPTNQYKQQPTRTQPTNQYKQQPTRTQPTNQYKQQPTRTQPTNQYKPPVRTQPSNNYNKPTPTRTQPSNNYNKPSPTRSTPSTPSRTSTPSKSMGTKPGAKKK